MLLLKFPLLQEARIESVRMDVSVLINLICMWVLSDKCKKMYQLYFGLTPLLVRVGVDAYAMDNSRP